MLTTLLRAERELPTLLRDEDDWIGLYADTERPHLRRLWRQWGAYRISLHQFQGCEEGQEFWHPHPWKCAIRTFSPYDMKVGVRDQTGELMEIARIRMQPGSCYEMTRARGEHAILPVVDEIWSLMVSGPIIWPENRRIANTPVRELFPDERARHFNFFGSHYPA